MKHQTISTSCFAPERAISSWSNALMSLLPVVAAVFAAAIFIADTFVTFDIAIAVLYVAVVLLSVSFCRRRGIIIIAAICMALTLASFFIQHSYDSGEE